MGSSANGWLSLIRRVQERVESVNARPGLGVYQHPACDLRHSPAFAFSRPLPSSASRESVKDCRSTLWAPARYLLVLTPILTLVPFTDSFLYSFLTAGGHLANFAIKRFGIQRGVRRVFGHWS